MLLSIKVFTSIVSENSERAAENKILRVQEKMQKEVDRAEKAESDALAKYAEARSNVNELSEQLMAERHRLNITATELEQKQDRVTKLLSERYLTCLFHVPNLL